MPMQIFQVLQPFEREPDRVDGPEGNAGQLRGILQQGDPAKHGRFRVAGLVEGERDPETGKGKDHQQMIPIEG